MLKRERLLKICNMVNEFGIVTVNDIINALDVSDMTVRRDLDELEKSGKLLRIHGGAQSLTFSLDHELSHVEKATVQSIEKQQIVKHASSLIKEGETIFLGPGTTIEMLANRIRGRNIRVVTNSYPVFETLINHKPTEVILTGGEYRSHTGAFVGPIANSILLKLKYTKAFIGCNGIFNSQITTYSLEEGEVQAIALSNSRNRYLLADYKKFNREDFYVYYDLHDFDAIITDQNLSKDTQEHYQQYTDIIIASTKF
ncbi:DeoR family transcriptional regulator [Breznakia blatticola]|uniref:Lactose phosphotransferase system repressor n=1 Tax=Breznakia blatticola TaxID=1754012 RepID=A0A4R8A5Z4_9FIRM|nr:DeoR/GlpR family DNA-binding transcription regulator [Breznakia blatticola]TDW26079.1 DeoR family transcriptional regulator [Breznakia blatticola]